MGLWASTRSDELTAEKVETMRTTGLEAIFLAEPDVCSNDMRIASIADMGLVAELGVSAIFLDNPSDAVIYYRNSTAANIPRPTPVDVGG